jgi:hypothetical protein
MSTSSAGSTVNTSEYSTLDAAGVAAIRNSKPARLDMTSGRVSKEAVRVTQDSYGPEINTRGSGKISLTIAAPAGDISISADSAENWISSTQADPGSRSDFSITSGRSTGLDVNYDLRYDGGKDTQVIIVHVRPVN